MNQDAHEVFGLKNLVNQLHGAGLVLAWYLREPLLGVPLRCWQDTFGPVSRRSNTSQLRMKSGLDVRDCPHSRMERVKDVVWAKNYIILYYIHHITSIAVLLQRCLQTVQEDLGV